MTIYTSIFIVKYGEIYFCNPAVMMTNNLCCVTLPSLFAEEMGIKANRLGPFLSHLNGVSKINMTNVEVIV